MAEVSVKINNKSYGIACDEGQEDRVRELGNYVNERLSSLVASGAASSEVQNLVLTCIVLADEIADLQDYNMKLEEQVTHPSGEGQVQIKEVEVIKEVPVEVPGALTDEDVEQVTDLVVEVTNRINSISNKLAKAA